MCDRSAQAVITTGGLGVLAAMLGICVFLVVVAFPLFMSGEASPPRTAPVPAGEASPLFGALSADSSWYTLVTPSGEGLIVKVETGEIVTRASVFTPTSPVTASTYERGTGWVFLGHENGSLSTGQLAVRDGIVPESGLPESLASMNAGEHRSLTADEVTSLNTNRLLRFEAPQASVFERFADGGKVTSLEFTLSDPVPLSTGAGPVRRIVGTAANEREQYALAAREDGSITLGAIRVRRSLSGGASSTRVTEFPVTTDPVSVPDWLMTDADGLHVISVHADGQTAHFARESNRSKEFILVDSMSLTEPGQTITAAIPALGARSMLIADSEGHVASWTFSPPSEREAGSGSDRRDARLALASRTQRGEPVVALATSNQDRTVAALNNKGEVNLVNMTSLRRIAHLPGTVAPSGLLTIGSDLDFVAVFDEDWKLTTWRLDPGYPEVGWRSLARPVRFEGYAEPKYVYQSTGSPGAETKMSLVPLIWGTLKATVVSMLIATPLAVLAALFTSEFLHPKLRRRIKPVIELMASLPSVVLGFVAAVLVAPFLRDHLSQILLAMLVLPLSLLIGSTLVRYIPTRTARRITSGRQLAMIASSLAAGAVLSWLLGPAVESMLFSTDAAASTQPGFIPWLNGRDGSATPGWLMATAPLAVIVLFLCWSRFFGRTWGERVSALSQPAAATSELARVLGLVLLGGLVGAAIAAGLSAIGLDPRDSIFGTYSQRNTLVVGIIMGFAVIPIIYTISEDAMQAVPSGLRSASLGAGATRWQTAVRVVLPVAGSGIFSAVMIGLGRAVGETMIVLMATGNTPEISANIFSGFRTLAANIAVELPEAPRGGTHYRVLFLCGLVLFVMTLVINTTAELVRQRVRRKNAAL